MAALLALVFAGLLLTVSSRLADQIDQTRGQLEAFDLARSVIVKGQWSGPITFSQDKPRGSIEQFLMSLASVRALSQLPGVEATHEFRDFMREGRRGDGAVQVVRVLVVPAGFLQAHGMGGPEADAMLAQGCVVARREWLLGAGWPEQAQIHWASTAEDRQYIAQMRARMGVPTAPSLDPSAFDSPVCSASLHMPSSVASFQNAVFVSIDHPGLRDRTSGAMPQLWLKLSKEAKAADTLQRLRQFLAHEAQAAHPQIQLQATPFSDYGIDSVGSRQVLQWQARLRWLAGLCGLAMLAALVFFRWGGLRRELALRQALGQAPVIAWRRTARPYVLAIAVGTVLGLALGAALALALWSTPAHLIAREAVQVLLVAGVALAILAMVLALALRGQPLHTLRLGAR